jgi:hypothetical protein
MNISQEYIEKNEEKNNSLLSRLWKWSQDEDLWEQTTSCHIGNKTSRGTKLNPINEELIRGWMMEKPAQWWISNFLFYLLKPIYAPFLQVSQSRKYISILSLINQPI